MPDSTTGKDARRIPRSLKTLLEKLPTPEALEVLEDIGAVAWVVDNNNNNKASALEQKVLDKVTALGPDRLREIL